MEPSIEGPSKSLGEYVSPRIKDARLKDTQDAMKRLGIKSGLAVAFPQESSPAISADKVENSRYGVAIVGRFIPWPWGQYPNEACLADVLESFGLRVVRISQDRYAPPAESVECVVFTAHPASFSRIERWKKTHPTVIWAPAIVPGFPEYDPILDAARQATLFLSADQFDWKRALGFTHHAYLPAACDLKFEAFSPRPKISCAFIGSVYSKRRCQIVEMVRGLGGIVFDRMKSWKYGLELSKFVQGVKVVVGDNARNDVPNFWSARNYIIPGGGGFLLTSKVPGLERDFVLDKELAVYGPEEELESKVIQWVADDSLREAVRKAGYERARKNHTWEVRAKTFLRIIAEKIYAAK